MDFLNSVYNDRWAGIAGVTCILVLEHLQAMSYIQEAIHQDSEGWSASALEVFESLSDLALHVSGRAFTFLFVFFSILISLIFLIYLSMSPYIHRWNRNPDIRKSGLIVLIDYGLLGALYIPIVGQFTIPQNCTMLEVAEADEDLKCWTKEQLAYFQAGLVMLNVAILIAAGISPALKNERLGTERKWGDEGYFEGVFKVQTALVVVLFCPVKLPEIGFLVTAALIAYLAYGDCYTEIHIASLKMGLLFGQFWLFLCACICRDDSDTASQLLVGWAPFIVVGYSVLYIKKLVFKRELQQLPIQK